MTYTVKIIGAGSIGNHLANASRAMGWDVTLCDLDDAALRRTQESIYPSRYGVWDSSIKLCNIKDVPRGLFDFIFIGTPPDTHVQLALDALDEKPLGILVEKPFSTPDMSNCIDFYNKARKMGVKIFVGYDHVVSKSAHFFSDKLKEFNSPAITIDVDFREHWGGIFSAHPWLSGPSDSYLGFYQRGGGALGEHSHGINFWQFVSQLVGGGRITNVQATVEYVKDNDVLYDSIGIMNFKTEHGLIGRCVQDVITKPSKKMARVQFANGYVEWHCSKLPGIDMVIYSKDGVSVEEMQFPKTRPDDFIAELKHIKSVIESENKDSAISIENGLDTMLVIAAAHLSNKVSQNITIDYSGGYQLKALRVSKQ